MSQLAGGSTHLETRPGETAHANGSPFFFLLGRSYALLHTQTLGSGSAQWGRISHKSYFSTLIIKLMQTHTQVYTHTLQLGRHSGILFELSPQVSSTQTHTHTCTYIHTHVYTHKDTRTLTESLYWSVLESHGNTSLWQHCNLGGMSTSNEQQPTHKHTQTGLL